MAVAPVGLVEITTFIMRPQNPVFPLLGGLQHSLVLCGFCFVPGQQWDGGGLRCAGLKKSPIFYVIRKNPKGERC